MRIPVGLKGSNNTKPFYIYPSNNGQYSFPLTNRLVTPVHVKSHLQHNLLDQTVGD